MKEKKYLAFFVMLVFVCVVNGQVIPPSIPPPNPPGLSIGGGVLFLIISGVLYGIKKVRD